MDVRAVERTAIDQWLRVVRLPIEAGAHLVNNGDNGPRNGLMLAIDRVDATIRDTLGRMLGNDELQHDARGRRAAADERARAIQLRMEAQTRKVEADRELAGRQDDAEQLRDEAARTAAQRDEHAADERRASEQRVRETAREQQSAVERSREEKEHEAEQSAKQERLRVLDQQADALDTQTDALTANDEAQRLATQAAKAKARRKRTPRTPR
jgi:hypothetical protein